MSVSELAELSEQVNAKIAAETEIRNFRIRYLKELDTRRIVEQIPKLELELEQAMRDDAGFRSLSSGYLASQGSDCAEVKRLLARISSQATGKNATEREAWITRQREEDKELSGAIIKQGDLSFTLENNRIRIEMAKKRLESTLKVLSLKTAQIEYLTVK